MVETTKKVNFYRLALARGKRHRMELSKEHRLVGNGGGYFSFLAPMFDSGDYNGTWHRLCMNGNFDGCKYEIIAAATNVDLQEIMEDESCTPMEQLELLKEYSYTRKVNTSDMLLHELQGRYLWIFISVSGSRVDSSFTIDGFHVEFPHGSFTEYLPEIYHQERGEFFERYMAVMQSLYEDLEKEVEYIPNYLDYETTSEENLPLFAQWTGDWAAGKKYSPEQLRYLIKNLQKIQSGRGTKEVMGQMIELVTGHKAMIVEYFKWHDWMSKNSNLLEVYERLFGKNEDTFTVIIDMSQSDKEISREWLRSFLEEYTPLGMHCNVVLLRANSNMDMHCYLDKNGCLSTPIAADAGGVVLGGNYILG
ncbi:MAG: hypothetical protein J6A94_00255 [Lachnospiraceae bacterium]|nr:hypothetical protein [Lachnospiraceae bacterium]